VIVCLPTISRDLPGSGVERFHARPKFSSRGAAGTPQARKQRPSTGDLPFQGDRQRHPAAGAALDETAQVLARGVVIAELERELTQHELTVTLAAGCLGQTLAQL